MRGQSDCPSKPSQWESLQSSPQPRVPASSIQFNARSSAPTPASAPVSILFVSETPEFESYSGFDSLGHALDDTLSLAHFTGSTMGTFGADFSAATEVTDRENPVLLNSPAELVKQVHPAKQSPALSAKPSEYSSELSANPL
uniref:Uncharacterized protein n=1 Tax=Ditylenchus dipsaci TaxID=166011 RepID=A0A915EPJ3_9BILA